MLKHIAVGLDGSSDSAAAEDLAFALASRLGAVVHGVHVVDASFLEGAFITDISGAMGFEPFLNLQSQVRSTLDEVAAAIRTRFEERAAGTGVQATAAVERAGVVAGLLSGAKLADLLVVGQRGINARFHQDALGPTTSALLRRAPIPVLVVPEGAVLPARPLVAYDGSPKAAAALRLASELCRALSLPLAVVTVDQDASHAQMMLKEAASYLEPFGIRSDLRHVPGEAVEKLVLERVKGGGHDLLCLGAHGHGRVVELVLGSTTEFLAARSPVAVLCATRA